jgi:hypothetical protein
MTKLAGRLLGAPMALVTLMTPDVQRFLGIYGLAASLSTPARQRYRTRSASTWSPRARR